MSTASPTGPRRRGRPTGGGGDARPAIIAAARAEFAAKGFAATSLRSVAAAAGVDPSLVRHYFGDKNGLIAASLTLPFSPIERLEQVLALPTEQLGEAIVRTFIESWDPHATVVAALVKATVGPDPLQVGALVEQIVMPRVARRIGGRDATHRAELIAAQLLGLMLTRYVLDLQAITAATPTQLARRYGPSLQALIDG